MVRWSKEKESGFPRIKQLTQVVLANNNCLNEMNKPDIDQIKKNTNWYKLFEQEAKSALKASGIHNAYEAIKISYPEACGWQSHQINPGDIRSESMWVGAEGKELFSKKFAKALFDIFCALKKDRVAGFEKTQVVFDPDSKPPINIQADEIRLLVSYMASKQINWTDIFSYFGLASPFDSICSGSKDRAFDLLLNRSATKKSALKAKSLQADLKKAGPRANSLKLLLNREIEGLSQIPEVLLFRSSYLKKNSPAKALSQFLQNKVRPNITSPIRITELCYEAYCNRNTSHSSDYSALENVLKAKTDGENIFGDRNIGVLLRLIKDDLLNECMLEPEHIEQVREAIDEVFKTRSETRKSLRDCLLEGIKNESLTNSPLGVINQIVSNLSAYASAWNYPRK